MQVIPNKIKVSFQIAEKPSPFIIIAFTILKNHFDGITFDNHCKGMGMLSTGNIKPLNINVGINKPTNVPNIAAV